MPMNLRKFEQIVTAHFATVTDEEFLENLRKSSPYLFTDESEVTKDIHISSTSDLNSNNCHEILNRQKLEENKLDRYRKVVKSLISNYANSDISNDKVEVQLVLDADRDHYQWMNVGWQGSDRIYRCVMHLDIKDGKIWLQQNLTDRDPAEELVNMGVAKEDIVLGLQMPSKRLYTDYGVA
jgi:XisI protein